MKILVTGGAGFIGSHIADAYIAAGHRVVVVDNLSTGFRKNIPKQVTFYKADICDGEKIENIFKKERPHTVNHHAAQISVVESVREPEIALNTNILGTATLLRAFAEHRSPGGKFIFASTGGAIYGNPKKLPATETTPPNPLSPYALSKMLAEDVVKFYAAQHNFPYLILRYSNVFGSRQNPKGEAGVVAIFIGMMRRGERPTIFGDGSKTRDYVYVGDVVRASLLGLKRGNNELVNISFGKELSDSEVFTTIAKHLKSDMKALHAPFRPGEVRRISLDRNKAKKVLGWIPRVTFETGVTTIVNG